jgi:hypothetical protein
MEDEGQRPIPLEQIDIERLSSPDRMHHAQDGKYGRQTCEEG